jgi:hypothetical protein
MSRGFFEITFRWAQLSQVALKVGSSILNVPFHTSLVFTKASKMPKVPFSCEGASSISRFPSVGSVLIPLFTELQRYQFKAEAH